MPNAQKHSSKRNNDHKPTPSTSHRLDGPTVKKAASHHQAPPSQPHEDELETTTGALKTPHEGAVESAVEEVKPQPEESHGMMDGARAQLGHAAHEARAVVDRASHSIEEATRKASELAAEAAKTTSDKMHDVQRKVGENLEAAGKKLEKAGKKLQA
jgi:hypothetical protein